MSFEQEVRSTIEDNGKNTFLLRATSEFMHQSITANYSYTFSWLGRPIIQYPQDMIAMQELIWQGKPDLIIETGIAHGGSLILSASMLAMIDYCEAVENRRVFDPRSSGRRVLGIDIDIRTHNRVAIEAHPLANKIDMIQGSSIATDIIDQVHEHAKGYKRILVCLDSSHTHEHVLAELNAYAPLVSKGSYCVVFDAVIEDLPDDTFSNRPWGKGNNPKTAVWEYLESHPEFVIDKTMQHKLLITVAPDGYLRKIL